MPKEREGHTETALLFNEEKELHQVIIEMRKRYDATKIEADQVNKNLERLEEERKRIQDLTEKMQG